MKVLNILPEFWDVKYNNNVGKMNWPHFVIDNFLREDFYNKLRSLQIELPVGCDHKVYHN